MSFFASINSNNNSSISNSVIILNNNLDINSNSEITPNETSTEAQIKLTLKEKLKNFYSKTFKTLKDKYCSESLVMGIDIRPNVIRVAISDEEKGVWKVKHLFAKNVANTLNFENLEKNKNLYATAIKQIIIENKIKNKNVALSIPTSMAIVKSITMPLMSEENFKKATRINSFWQNLVQISDNLKDYSIFYKIARKLPESSEMEVLFVAAKTKDIKVYTDILNAAGLEVLVVDVSCFSLNNLSKLKDEQTHDEKIKTSIKIGSDENFLEINDKGKPYIYDIFVPENEKMYVDEYIEHATFQTRFIAQVKHILSKHKESFAIDISEIEIIASSPNINIFIDAISESLEGVKITQTNLFEDVTFSKNVLQKIEQQKNEWAIAVGLSTRKLKLFNDKNDSEISDKVNLAFNNQDNTEKLKAKFISKIILSGLAAFCACLLVFLTLVFYTQYKIKVAQITKFNELNKIYIEKSANFKQITSDSGTLMKLVKANQTLGSNQDLLVTSLKDVSGLIPDGVWVQQLDFSFPLKEVGIKDDETKPKIMNIKITGKAFDEGNILKFSRNLDDSQIIKNTNIDSIKIIQSDEGGISREFIINGQIIRGEK